MDRWECTSQSFLPATSTQTLVRRPLHFADKEMHPTNTDCNKATHSYIVTSKTEKKVIEKWLYHDTVQWKALCGWTDLS